MTFQTFSKRKKGVSVISFSFSVCFLRGFALTLNCLYRVVQICGTDTCRALERTGEEVEETTGSDLGLSPSRSWSPPLC